MLAAILAHNLYRDLQIVTQSSSRQRSPSDRHYGTSCRSTLFKRPALWDFMQINTIRQKFIQCVGRLIQPQGELMLSMNMSGSTQAELLQIVGVLEQVA